MKGCWALLESRGPLEGLSPIRDEMFIAPVVLINRRARLRAKEYFAPLELATILYGGSINISPLSGSRLWFRPFRLAIPTKLKGGPEPATKRSPQLISHHASAGLNFFGGGFFFAPFASGGGPSSSDLVILLIMNCCRKPTIFPTSQ